MLIPIAHSQIKTLESGYDWIAVIMGEVIKAVTCLAESSKDKVWPYGWIKLTVKLKGMIFIVWHWRKVMTNCWFYPAWRESGQFKLSPMYFTAVLKEILLLVTSADKTYPTTVPVHVKCIHLDWARIVCGRRRDTQVCTLCLSSAYCIYPSF